MVVVEVEASFPELSGLTGSFAWMAFVDLPPSLPPPDTGQKDDLQTASSSLPIEFQRLSKLQEKHRTWDIFIFNMKLIKIQTLFVIM